MPGERSTSITNCNSPTKTTLTSRRSKRVIYVPILICLWSYLCNTDVFRDILHEAYRIVTYNEIVSNDINLTPKILQNYRKCELLNYFIFLSNVRKPPNISKITLNFPNSFVDIYSPSSREIPSGDSTIKILFDYLEISIVIKLWCAILNEKRIIIMANQSYLLFAVCEALLKLIFPFKWLHTYIPILPDSFLEYLENPTPFIYGVSTSSVDFKTLKETYPTYVICNVDTSQLHFEENHLTTIPFNEETILRKKLQFVKNPLFFDVEEIVFNPKCKTLIEDVNPNRSFSENVQYIFFRIIRNGLKGFPGRFLNNNIFDSESLK